MSIPTMPIHHVVYAPITSIPVMPFIAVLLLKLQGWADHRVSHRMDLRMKQHVDAGDIYELLGIAAQNSEMHIRNQSWLPESFVVAGRRRVVNFIRVQSNSAVHWRQIGLVITDGKGAVRRR
jgi:hypothetical protein